MRTAVCRFIARKAKFSAYGKAPSPKEARVDRRNAHRSCVGGSDSSTDRSHLRNAILQDILFRPVPNFLARGELARELGCSRTVILTAWDLLYAEGYLESMPRGGVTVASVKQAKPGAGDVLPGGGLNNCRDWSSLRSLEIGAGIRVRQPTGSPNSVPARRMFPAFIQGVGEAAAAGVAESQEFRLSRIFRPRAIRYCGAKSANFLGSVRVWPACRAMWR